MTLAPLPPYALAVPSFPFRHLVGLAGRAPIGGTREVALACFVAARLAADHARFDDDDDTTRATRSAGAKAWLGTLALPASVRATATRCAECTATGTRQEMGKELKSLASAATSYLDVGSRAELEALVLSLFG